MTVPERLHHFAKTDPDRVAVASERGSVSYRVLARSVDRLAAMMVKSGILPGEPVGLTVRDEYHHLVAALALMRIGCPNLILATHEPASVRTELANRCKISRIVADEASGAGADTHVLAPDFERVFDDAEFDGARLPSPRDDDVAVLATSSGTTGRPKIMPTTHGQLVDQALAAGLPVGPLVLYFPASVEFYASQRHRSFAVCLGATNVFFDLAKESFVDGCVRHRVNIVCMSSGQARGVVDETRRSSQGRRLQNTRVRIFGSMVGTGLRRSFAETLTEDVEIAYGATECGCVAAIDGEDANTAGSGSVGRLLPGVSVEIVDDNGAAAGPGEPGSIRVRTRGMIGGYLDDSTLTARMFKDGWFYPGDVGRLTADGLLVLEGRADDIMNLSGIKISPAELEAVAETFPGVVECAAFSIKSPVHGDIPALAVATEGSVDLEALRQFCRARLGVRAPRRIVKLDRLPRTSAGKVSSAQLRSMLNADA